MAPFQRTHHVTTNHLVDLDGDRAAVRFNLIATHVLADDVRERRGEAPGAASPSATTTRARSCGQEQVGGSATRRCTSHGPTAPLPLRRPPDRRSPGERVGQGPEQRRRYGHLRHPGGDTPLRGAADGQLPPLGPRRLAVAPITTPLQVVATERRWVGAGSGRRLRSPGNAVTGRNRLDVPFAGPRWFVEVPGRVLRHEAQDRMPRHTRPTPTSAPAPPSPRQQAPAAMRGRVARASSVSLLAGVSRCRRERRRSGPAARRPQGSRRRSR
jgi:SnoaL-like protein